ncbi:MAG: DNA-3-methyladenine glycosylase [Phycisphaerales bacterium]|nr:DNA-3-methyladenine glycosylase [Phycisphaerales bacterium]
MPRRTTSRSDRTRIPAAEYARDATALAPRLIGRRLVREIDGTRLAGIIVETEAYVGTQDRACHSFGGRRTARNETMYCAGGCAYIYFTYGMHDMFNVVCSRAGDPVAVLIRALEPTEGVDVMHRLRSARPRKTPLRDCDLCSGPGKLCQALGINRDLDQADLRTGKRVWIEQGEGPAEPTELTVTTRIGVENCGEWANAPLRWLRRGSRYISVPAKPLVDFADS